MEAADGRLGYDAKLIWLSLECELYESIIDVLTNSEGEIHSMVYSSQGLQKVAGGFTSPDDPSDVR